MLLKISMSSDAVAPAHERRNNSKAIESREVGCRRRQRLSNETVFSQLLPSLSQYQQISIKRTFKVLEILLKLGIDLANGLAKGTKVIRDSAEVGALWLRMIRAKDRHSEPKVCTAVRRTRLSLLKGTNSGSESVVLQTGLQDGMKAQCPVAHPDSN